MYENFATKYRPKTFDDVKGQGSIIQTLSNSLKLKRIARAYLFFGPRGCGKTTAARILAKSLNCHNPKNHIPCDKCASCLEISRSKSLDVLEIDAASHTQVDKIREVIVENINIAPSRDKYKIYILDEVHMLSNSSFNALLKTVEEPPPHVVFIMATTEQTKVPTTITSRCQSFRFRLIDKGVIEERLKDILSNEKIKASPEVLKVISEASGGAMRDALTILDRCASFAGGNLDLDSVRNLLGLVDEDLMRNLSFAILDKNAELLHKSFIEISSEGYDAQVILGNLRSLFSEAFLFSQGFSKNAPRLAKDISAKKSPSLLAKMARHLGIIMDEVRFSDSIDIASEMALFTLIEKTADIEALINRLNVLEQKISTSNYNDEKPVVSDISPKYSEPASRPFGADEKKSYSDKTDAPPAVAVQSKPETSALDVSNKPHEGSPFVWKKLLGRITSQRPFLYNILISLKVVFEDEKTWHLFSGNKFEFETIKKSRVELEKIVEEIAGINITIIPFMEKPGAKTVQMEEISNSETVEEEAVETDNPSVKWEDLPSDENFDSDPELKGIKKIYKGVKITKINKVK